MNELVLIIDTSTTMTVWKDFIEQWINKVKRNSVFSTVKTVYVDTSCNDLPFDFTLRIFSKRTQAVWVISDCIGNNWHNGKIFQQLTELQKSCSVAVAQVLSFYLWEKTALGRGVPCRIFSNLKTYDITANAKDVQNSSVELVLPIFIITDSISCDLHLNMFLGKAEDSNWSAGFLFLKNTVYQQENKKSEIESVSSVESTSNEISWIKREKRLSYFQRTSSPSARILAAHLAAIPITIPLIQRVFDIVCRKNSEMSGDRSCITEILCSRLLTKIEGVDEEEYDFLPTVREQLLDGISVYKDARGLLCMASAYYREKGKPCVDFAEILSNPNPKEVEKLIISKEMVHFARIGAEVLCRMGGEYMKCGSLLKTNSFLR